MVRTRIPDPIVSTMSATGTPRLAVPPSGASTRFASVQLGAPLALEPLVIPSAVSYTHLTLPTKA